MAYEPDAIPGKSQTDRTSKLQPSGPNVIIKNSLRGACNDNYYEGLA